MRIFPVFAALFVVTSCSFIRINENALSNIINSELGGGINVSTQSGPKVKADKNIVTRTFDVEEFNEIQSDIAADIKFVQGETGLRVSIPQNVEQYLRTDVRNGRLHIYFSGARVRNLEDAVIYVSTPQINSIELNGAGDIEMEGTVNTENLKIQLNGAGDLEADAVNVSGKIVVELNGAGDIDIENLECGEIVSNINGAGDSEFSGHAGKATLNINGAGDIDISGFVADELNTGVHGAGIVHRK